MALWAAELHESAALLDDMPKPSHRGAYPAYAGGPETGSVSDPQIGTLSVSEGP
jgi:hypothetical protein